MHIFNGLVVGVATLASFEAIDALPDLQPLPAIETPLTARPVDLAPVGGPLRIAGAWELEAGDPRFGGVSALTLDRGRLLAVTDRGAVVRFDLPDTGEPQVWLADLRVGPGPFVKKRARDAESLVRDPQGRGWWVGYEQHHSLWLYDATFTHPLASIDLRRSNWSDNRGAEGLTVTDGKLAVFGENGRDAVRIEASGPEMLKLHSNADVAEAARAPDGGIWVLLRKKTLGGIEQSIAPLRRTHDGYQVLPGWPAPKGAFDNFEGMAIEARPGGWRFWLISDDGHRIMARTLLVALDLVLPVRHDKSSARSAGPSRKPAVEAP